MFVGVCLLVDLDSGYSSARILYSPYLDTANLLGCSTHHVHAVFTVPNNLAQAVAWAVRVRTGVGVDEVRVARGVDVLVRRDVLRTNAPPAAVSKRNTSVRPAS